MSIILDLEWVDATDLLENRQATPLIGIYKIENTTNGKIYIGQSTHIKKRISEGHIYKLKRGNHRNKYLQRAWNKYGENTFRFYYIKLDSVKALTETEEGYIRYYDSCNNKKGYNLILAEDSKYGFRHSKESKEKIRNSLLGENNHRYGTTMSEDHKKHLISINQVKIVQFDFNRNLVKVWSSIKQAADYYNVRPGAIGSVLRNETGSSCGFYWAYYEEYSNNTVDFKTKESIRLKNKRGVVQLTKTEEYVNEYESITDAVNLTGVKGIRYVLSGEQKTSGGFRWVYKDDYILTTKGE